MADIESYIRQAARQRGIDPDIAVRVARYEGGFKNPTQQSYSKKGGVREPSYGPFQLLIGGEGTNFPAGMGNDALKAGIDPRDPNQWQRGVDFALDRASRNGWGAWYGAKAAGIGNMQGIGGSRGLTLDNSAPVGVQKLAQAGRPEFGSSPDPVQPVQVAGGGTAGVGASAAAAAEPAVKPPSIFDTFKNDGFEAGMKALAGDKNMMGGIGALAKLFGGGNKGGDDGSARIDPAQGIAASEQADASRVQASQQLMSTLLGTNKLRNPVRGLSLMG